MKAVKQGQVLFKITSVQTSGADPGFEGGGSTMKTRAKRARQILGHTPKIDKPRLLFAAIASFLAVKCSVSTMF